MVRVEYGLGKSVLMTQIQLGILRSIRAKGAVRGKMTHVYLVTSKAGTKIRSNRRVLRPLIDKGMIFCMGVRRGLNKRDGSVGLTPDGETVLALLD